MRRRIAVILGGRSSENAISLASGASVIDALERSGNDVVTVQIDRAGRWQLGAGTKAIGLGCLGSRTSMTVKPSLNMWPT